MHLNCQLTDFEKLYYVMNALPRNASFFELLNEETKRFTTRSAGINVCTDS